MTKPKAKAPRLRLKGEPTEDELQASIANLLDWVLGDDVDWTHIAHGGYELGPAARGRLFRLGLKKGFTDLVICYSGGRTLWLEVKTRFGVTSQAQRRRHERMQANRHQVVVVRCVEDVLAALETYGVPYKKVRLAEMYRGETKMGNVGTEARSPTERQERVGTPVAGEALRAKFSKKENTGTVPASE